MKLKSKQPRQEAGYGRGQFASRNEAVCVCGHRKGEHTACRGKDDQGKPYQPCLHGEVSSGPHCACTCFRKKR